MFYLHTFILAITLSAIYICLKWHHLPMISKREREISDPDSRREWIKRQDVIRLLIIILVIVINIMGYCLWDYNGSAYLAIMSLLCLPFIITKKEK